MKYTCAINRNFGDIIFHITRQKNWPPSTRTRNMSASLVIGNLNVSVYSLHQLDTASLKTIPSVDKDHNWIWNNNSQYNKSVIHHDNIVALLWLNAMQLHQRNQANIKFTLECRVYELIKELIEQCDCSSQSIFVKKSRDKWGIRVFRIANIRSWRTVAACHLWHMNN